MSKFDRPKLPVYTRVPGTWYISTHTHDLYLDTQVLECTHHGTHGHACTKYQYLVHGTWTWKIVLNLVLYSWLQQNKVFI